MKNTLALLIPFFILVMSCNKNDDSCFQVIKIRYGTSFGECLGYCKKDVYLEQGSVTYVRSAWTDTLETITCTESLSGESWKSFRSGLDARNFFNLPEVFGCPDCADGGAEYIEIQLISGVKHKVTFEYMNEPEILKDYVVGLRQQAERSIHCGEFQP